MRNHSLVELDFLIGKQMSKMSKAMSSPTQISQWPGAQYNQVIDGRDGVFLFNRHDMYIGRSLAHYGEFSHLEMRMLRQLCGEGDVVLEVGANIGSHTVGLAKHIGPAGRVLAFEPQRLVFQTLCANVALNSLSQVDCYWAGVGSESGYVTVPELPPEEEENFGGVSLLDGLAGRHVPCMTLDDFCGAPHIELIKIDVEGMELDVLAGAQQLLHQFRPHLYVENDRPETAQALMRWLDQHGYRMFWHFPPLFNPDNHFGRTDNLFGSLVSANMVCVHHSRPLPAAVAGLEPATDFAWHPILGRLP